MRLWSIGNLSSRIALVAAASVIATAAAAQEQSGLEPALLDASVNGVRVQEPLLVLRGDDGALFVPEAKLEAWRMTLRAQDKIMHDGEVYVDLSDIEGLSFEISEETQSLEITASPEQIMPSTLSLWANEPGPMTPSAGGGFFNYEILGEYSSGFFTANGLFEAVLFSRHGFVASTFVARTSPDGTDVTRLDTNWTIDDPDRMRSLRIGDGVSRGGIAGGPLRFGGVQFGSNFGVQPGFITIPLPTIDGSAALPSVVDVYVNDSLRGSTQVPPGPFSISEIPVITGGGDVQLVVRDMLGRESAISQSYYVSPKLLREGLHEHSSEVGFLRNHYARKSHDYGAMFLSTTHRYGISDDLTGEVHIQATREAQGAGVAGAVLLPGMGLFEVSAAMSRDDGTIGHKFGFGFERRTSGLSLGARSEFTSRDYRSIGMVDDRLPPSKTIQLFAGLPVNFGSLGFSYILRDARSEPDAEIIAGSASFRLKNLGSLYLTARTDLRQEGASGIHLGFVLPLGQRSSLNVGARRDEGRNSFIADLQRNLPAGEGIGYRVSAAAGELERLSGRLSVQSRTGNYDAELATTDGKWGARAVASGAVAWLGGEIFASRRLTESFGIVRVGEFENVRVYADNQAVGTTNKKGVAIIPRLRPFDRNVIRLELADLPMNASVTGGERIVRPFDRSGVAISFDAKISRTATLRIVLEDGTAVPAGSAVLVNGGSEEFVIAPGGETYLTGLGRHNDARVLLDGKVCAFSFEFPETDDPQPDLGVFTCARD